MARTCVINLVVCARNSSWSEFHVFFEECKGRWGSLRIHHLNNALAGNAAEALCTAIIEAVMRKSTYPDGGFFSGTLQGHLWGKDIVARRIAESAIVHLRCEVVSIKEIEDQLIVIKIYERVFKCDKLS